MPSYNSPSNICWIVILNGPNAKVDGPSTRIKFQTMPATITDAKQAIYEDIPVIARSVPMRTYQFSSVRTIAFTLEFFANIEADDILNNSADVQKQVALLKSLVYPDYSGNTVAGPPKCLVHIGDNIKMEAFCENVQVTLRGDYPWDVGAGPGQASDKKYAHYASVSLVFKETGEVPFSTQDIYVDALK